MFKSKIDDKNVDQKLSKIVNYKAGVNKELKSIYQTEKQK